MKTKLQFAALLVALSTAHAASTINSTNHYAWAGNIGWVDFHAERPNAGDGFHFGDYTCSGYLWSPNIGWINCGNGSPANGTSYGNFNNTDFGVNHSGNGDLTGLAWSPNVGWINFGWAASTNVNRPRVDLLTGQFSGYVWGANVGWIDLASSSLKTDRMEITDTDNDGISDAYEIYYAGDLDTMNSTTDTDGDGIKDKDEFIAGTSSYSFTPKFKILSFTKTGPSFYALNYPSTPNRVYGIEAKQSLTDTNWIFLGDVLASSGTNTIQPLNLGVPQIYIRMQAKLPLQP